MLGSPASKHNKSGLGRLSIIHDELRDHYLNAFESWLGSAHVTKKRGLFYGSRCKCGPADGRFCVRGKKVAFMGQLAVAHKLGWDALEEIASRKDRHNANEGEWLSVSHLCGDCTCGNPSHVIVESKGVNDSRKACHQVLGYRMQKWMEAHPKPKGHVKKHAWKELRLQFIHDWIRDNCSHRPFCCMKEDFEFDDDD